MTYYCHPEVLEWVTLNNVMVREPHHDITRKPRHDITREPRHDITREPHHDDIATRQLRNHRGIIYNDNGIYCSF
jgi:hypothetical protein